MGRHDTTQVPVHPVHATKYFQPHALPSTARTSRRSLPRPPAPRTRRRALSMPAFALPSPTTFPLLLSTFAHAAPRSSSPTGASSTTVPSLPIRATAPSPSPSIPPPPPQAQTQSPARSPHLSHPALLAPAPSPATPSSAPKHNPPIDGLHECGELVVVCGGGEEGTGGGLGL
ncbi:hypothetical protein JB92DRAFT_3132009 [Gautieria morchelliformis]|nr:hypothetical protein JB92DRAFT_3132009 [Gautieria morchelliformis]